MIGQTQKTARGVPQTPISGLATDRLGDTVTSTNPSAPLPAARPETQDETARTILRLAKFIDIHVTRDDQLLANLEWAYANHAFDGMTELTNAATRILNRASTLTWGGAR